MTRGRGRARSWAEAVAIGAWAVAMNGCLLEFPDYGLGGAGGTSVGAAGGTSAGGLGGDGGGGGGIGGDGGGPPCEGTDLPLGSACACDEACASGSCWRDSAGPVGAPSGGMCSADCAADPCAEGVCQAFASGGDQVLRCVPTCTFGATDPAKCLGRLTLGCSDELSSSAEVDACIPRCHGDSDCGAGAECSTKTGLCTTMSADGDLPPGKPCDENADACAGACSSGHCEERCVIGAPSSCGAEGVCAESEDGGALVDGDLGSCALSCGCGTECWPAQTCLLDEGFCAFGGPVGGVCGLSNEGVVARYFIDEAANGTTPGALADAAGGVALDLTYDASLAFETQPHGRGIASPNATHDGIASSAGSDLSALSASLSGTTATFELVFRANAAASGSTLLSIREPAPGSASQIRLGLTTAPTLTFARGAVNNEAILFSLADQLTVLHWVVDTGQASGADRIEAWIDGAATGAIAEVATASGAAVLTTQAGVLSLLSDGNTTFGGALYYAAIYDRALDAATIAQHAAVLASFHDEP